ncbi:ABC transporter ATP-binding protein [Lactobacillus hominis]|uniref:ABC superfamily ATP binding cassette transporter, ABC protein n=1 Tax=Lactobacillus hominis DSM 23910 = CRBIP 24.179 TaxID=1423758 RepID=I7L5A3_9LACO|nr:ATP-binding cassette domain-containing protein [Lactobacillus hominis]KRM85307.1 ABC superfamily ATP binding cassette transporter, ABC protein [Lactobacillus hominis DSM 23910 = CRBIP 24.179]MCT3347617.1 ATP-binding cassette domain-containing protein [Lactobacillus hominis]CCI81277.1 ABC superfamily ATP binding cassette transporter, ABC protein [Lactobacillus hominis DSM 23910 = CRBIP 24.179]
MTEPILELKDVKTTVKSADGQVIPILKGINLKINVGDFITIIGTNGAGKSTLLSTIAGNLRPSSGSIMHNGADITKWNEEKRTQFIARVFQDPKLGTAPRMTVAENLLLATKRGMRKPLTLRKLKPKIPEFIELAKSMNNGLENRMNTFVSGLSGGQRQALSFLMATIKRPDILLLDEHTAALDPHTSQNLLNVTDQKIKQDHLTALMITHHMEDALKYGNRLLVLKDGKVKADINQEEKEKLQVSDLYNFFE